MAAKASLFRLSAMDVPQGVYPSAHGAELLFSPCLETIGTDTAMPTPVQGFV